MYTVKTKAKMLKAQFVVAMTKNRYMGNHPRTKRFILGSFATLVIGYVGFNISLSMPEISFKWESEPVTYEQRAQAKFEASNAIVEEVKITDCYSASKVMSKKYSVPEELMNKIIKAESGNNHLVENKVSTATGCSQWILGSWRSYGKQLWGDEFHSKNIYSPADNVELMAWAISKFGTSPWDASRAVWGK